MKLSGHQTNFLPYLGFWSKLAASDVMDLDPWTQFSRGGKDCWMHRVKIGTDEKWVYWSLPIHKDWPVKIHEVRLKNEGMQAKWDELKAVHGESPFWGDFSYALHARLFDNFDLMYKLNMELLYWIRDILRSPFNTLHAPWKFACLPREPPGETTTDRIQEMCYAYEATTYISGLGGREYLDMARLRTPLLYSAPKLPPPYQTVSVISALLEKGPEWTRDAILKSVNLEKP